MNPTTGKPVVHGHSGSVAQAAVHHADAVNGALQKEIGTAPSAAAGAAGATIEHGPSSVVVRVAPPPTTQHVKKEISSAVHKATEKLQKKLKVALGHSTDVSNKILK